MQINRSARKTHSNAWLRFTWATRSPNTQKRGSSRGSSQGIGGDSGNVKEREAHVSRRKGGRVGGDSACLKFSRDRGDSGNVKGREAHVS